MAKVRIYKLAEEIGMQSKEVVNILQELDIDVTSHMSTIDEETAEIVKKMLTEEEEEDKTEEVEGITKEEKDLEEKQKEEFKVTLPVNVKELTEIINIQPNNLIKTLINMGIMVNLNQTLNKDIINKIANKMNINIVIEDNEKKDNTIKKIQDKKKIDPQKLKLRPPIVTVMGHVDHGKTTLLDYIRKTSVAKQEAGGITQHIGAYQTTINNKKITFIDTPGHEAFTAMRARGAQLTDIVILVVAADDGVMPQTVEAINHARAADIPIIVAINKIDKANAQPERVKQELTEHGLVTEEWGGETICVPISALKEENIDELLEMILLVAEMEEIKANPDCDAEGIIIEAELDKGKGPVATILIKNGTLKVGDSLLAGLTYGRVRAMLDENGNRIEKATPSTPVIVLGFSDVPRAGDYAEVLNHKKAREIATRRREQKHHEELRQEAHISLEDLYQQIQEGEVKELNIIIKADVQGSIEALRDALLKLSTEEVGINIIHTGVGGINETDVNLASTTNAIIIGFNVRPDSNAMLISEKENVEIRNYRVIYKVIDEIKDAMAGLLEPELKEVVKGRAEVRATFKVPDVGIIAGAYMKQGVVNRNFNIRLIRDGVVIHEGNIDSLKRFENDVREVKEGYECGIGIENYDDIKVGDILEIYTYKEIKRSL